MTPLIVVDSGYVKMRLLNAVTGKLHDFNPSKANDHFFLLGVEMLKVSFIPFVKLLRNTNIAR